MDFFESLKRGESTSIRQLAQDIRYGTQKAAKNARFSREDAEELLNDALVITIRNIRNGKFEYKDVLPSTYALGVVRKLIANKLRKRKMEIAELTGKEDIPDVNPELYYIQKEKEQLVEKLLNRLGEVCQKILRLKYFEGLKDAEIIERQLTGFSSINSLKSKRSLCLKRLVKISQPVRN